MLTASRVQPTDSKDGTSAESAAGFELRMNRRSLRVGFEIYVQCFAKTAELGLARAVVREHFPVVAEQSELDYWRVRFDATNSCDVGVTPLESDRTRLKSLYVDRPCAHPDLWSALFFLLQLGYVVIFWPGGPPVVWNETIAKELPKDVVRCLGAPRLASSGEDLLRLLNEC